MSFILDKRRFIAALSRSVLIENQYVGFDKFFKKNYWKARAILSQVHKMLDPVSERASCRQAIMNAVLYLQQERMKLINSQNCYTLSILLSRFLFDMLSIEPARQRRVLDYLHLSAELQRYDREITLYSSPGHGIIVAEAQKYKGEMVARLRDLESADPIQEKLNEILNNSSSSNVRNDDDTEKSFSSLVTSIRV